MLGFTEDIMFLSLCEYALKDCLALRGEKRLC